jgi:hypothetical protein
MKSFTKQVGKATLALAMIFTFALLSEVAYAQSEERGFILSTTELTIKSGQNTQFQEGVKAWKACYLENNGDWNWNMWRRVQGEGNVYILSSTMDKWAEMDETDEAGRKCRDLVRDLINPHIEKSESNLARYMPASSRSTQDENNVIWVTSWRVNNGMKFREILKDVTEAVRTAEGDARAYWYSRIGGGPESADFLSVTAYPNFAAMDVERDPTFTIVENVHGKEKRDQLQADLRESLDNVWSYIFRRVDDLSNRPSE